MFHSNLLRHFCSYASREAGELGVDERDCSHNIPGLVGISWSMSRDMGCWQTNRIVFNLLMMMGWIASQSSLSTLIAFLSRHQPNGLHPDQAMYSKRLTLCEVRSNSQRRPIWRHWRHVFTAWITLICRDCVHGSTVNSLRTHQYCARRSLITNRIIPQFCKDY